MPQDPCSSLKHGLRVHALNFLTFHSVHILVFRTITYLSLTKVTHQLNEIHVTSYYNQPLPTIFSSGVPVLHLIPAPFPPQWHDVSDTIDNVDLDSIHDIQLMVATFLCNIFEVSPSSYVDLLQL